MHNAVVGSFIVAAVNSIDVDAAVSRSGSFVMQSSAVNCRAVTRNSAYSAAPARRVTCLNMEHIARFLQHFNTDTTGCKRAELDSKLLLLLTSLGV
jgi:hypothetical protein